MISRSVFLQGIQKIMEVLPPVKGLTDKGIEVYYEHLENRFTDASFTSCVSEIIATQRDFPRISDFILRSPAVVDQETLTKLRAKLAQYED